MRNRILTVAACAALSVTASAQTTPAPTRPPDPLHAWVGLTDAAGLNNWTEWHLTEARKQIDLLKSVKGARTVANTLKPYDDAQLHLGIAGHQAGLMFATSPHKDIRDAGQKLL